MEETRKYFDYELAYNGYKKAKELLERGGIQTLVNNEEFEISGGATIKDWACSGYIPLYASGYNATIYVIDRNFDKSKNKNDWYVSGEVDIYSYNGGDDNLYINSSVAIQERIDGLLDYAKRNDYTLNDIYEEYDSLTKTLERIEKNESNI